MNPFTQLSVHYETGIHEAHVCWELNAQYEGATFVVRKSPDGETNIEIVARDLPWGHRDFTDKKFHLGNRTSRYFYQVIMRYGGQAYYSSFVEASGRKSHVSETALATQEQQTDIVEQADNDYVPQPRHQTTPDNITLGLVQHITNLEKINLRARGTRAAILKPKRQGELSYRGIDQDTGQETNTLGADRYGEKYVGGFEPPIMTYMLGKVARTNKLSPRPTGEGDDDKYIYAVRMLAQPPVHQDDIVVDMKDGSRYAVHESKEYQLKGSHSIVLDVALILLDFKDPVYKFSVDDAPVFNPDLPWGDGPAPPDTPYDPDKPSGAR